MILEQNWALTPSLSLSLSLSHTHKTWRIIWSHDHNLQTKTYLQNSCNTIAIEVKYSKHFPPKRMHIWSPTHPPHAEANQLVFFFVEYLSFYSWRAAVLQHSSSPLLTSIFFSALGETPWAEQLDTLKQTQPPKLIFSHLPCTYLKKHRGPMHLRGVLS